LVEIFPGLQISAALWGLSVRLFIRTSYSQSFTKIPTGKSSEDITILSLQYLFLN
jgi:hypothetical protein